MIDVEQHGATRSWPNAAGRCATVGLECPRLCRLSREFCSPVLLVILLLAAAYLAWLGMHVLLLTFAGILFAVLLSSLSGWLSQHTGLGHRLSLAIVVVGLLLLASGADLAPGEPPRRTVSGLDTAVAPFG